MIKYAAMGLLALVVAVGCSQEERDQAKADVKTVTDAVKDVSKETADKAKAMAQEGIEKNKKEDPMDTLKKMQGD
jgi:outer membrane lipoprotein-sorting protein